MTPHATDRPVPHATPSAADRVAPPVVELRGTIARDLAPYVRDKVLHALDHGVHPIGAARVRVVRHDDPARERPVVASAHVDLAGRRLHVHVVGSEPREAVDLLVDRLRRRVGDVHARRRHHRTGAPESGREPDAAVDRHDVVQAVPTSVTDAVAVMEARDEAFHLFVERTTGRRAVVYRVGATGRRLALSDGSAPAASERDGLTVSPDPARTASPEEAVEHLRVSGWPFLFFHDPERGRTRVVHLDDRGRAVLVDVEAEMEAGVEADVEADVEAGAEAGGPRPAP